MMITITLVRLFWLLDNLQALQIPMIARPFSIKSDYIHNHYTDEIEDERKIPISKMDNKS